MCVISFYRRLDENVDGTGGEGEFVEQEEQDQGLFANQGKLYLEHTIVLLFLCIMFPFCKLHNYWYYYLSGRIGSRNVGYTQGHGKPS